MEEYSNAIVVKGLTKRYDGFVLDDVSFQLPKGSIMGFIGQNGAGKTTTIKSILNIIHADSGTIEMLGMDHLADETAIKEQIGVVFDEMPFHDDLNARHLNLIFRELYPAWSSETFQKYLARFALPEKKKIGQFSKGMKMKLQIATALSHDAKLLIMDEATTGLDPVVRSEILELFLEYLQDESHSIFMSSHITTDIEKIADSVTFIDKGRLLLSGFKDDILQRHAVIKCTKADYEQIDPSDFVSARLTQFGAEILVAERAQYEKKYSGLIFDPTTLDEIMVFYVNSTKKEWSR